MIEHTLEKFKAGQLSLADAALEVASVLRAECAASHAALLRVEQLHSERVYSKAEGGVQTVGYCESCNQPHPCQTRRAIRGEPPVVTDYSVR